VFRGAALKYQYADPKHNTTTHAHVDVHSLPYFLAFFEVKAKSFPVVFIHDFKTGSSLSFVSRAPYLPPLLLQGNMGPWDKHSLDY
jgi:hypothetical protein